MSVTAAQGFTAAGVPAGLKSTGAPDVAVVVNHGPSRAAAAVFTSNRCKANPVLWSQEAIKDGSAVAVAINSGGANCYTGPDGFAITHQTAETVAGLVGAGAVDVQVCSTGLIGLLNDRETVLAGVRAAVERQSADGGHAAATAIMTTDSVAKEAVAHGDGYVVGGMAKGAGMLAPALATMLVVITTDADVDPATVDAALRAATAQTFDRLDSDGCQSTNDTVLLMASGASGVTPEAAAFTETVTTVCRDLALQLLADAEGAEHEIAIEVVGAADGRRRARGRPCRGPQQPVQVRDLRQGPQLGPHPRLGRHDPGGLRPGRPERRAQRRLGVPRQQPRRVARRDRPGRPCRVRDDRPQVR
jgi:glutamate N-acetyltransferase/amino-acid N-acetyltransferase